MRAAGSAVGAGAGVVLIGVPSGGGSAVGPRERETPRAPRARGVVCGGCSASGHGHRNPMPVEKAEAAELHGQKCATAPPRVARTHRGTGEAEGPQASGPSPDRLTVM